MKKTKKETFIYRAFGFPIKLINAPMKKVVGEWVIDIDFEALEKAIVRILIHKKTPLIGPELRFIRKFLEMTTTEFGKLFGVSHVAVVKWESEKNHISIPGDIYIRLYLLDYLKVKDKEFRSLYLEINSQILSQKKTSKINPLTINVDEDLATA